MDRTPERGLMRANLLSDVVRTALTQDSPTPNRMLPTIPVSDSPRRSQRVKKPPPITPRRFTKFFAPQRQKPPMNKQKSRPALKDVAATDLNRRQNEPTERPAKRRKLSFTSSPISSSLPSSPVKKVGFLSSSQDYHQDSDLDIDGDESQDSDDSEASTTVAEPTSKGRMKQYRSRSLSSRLLATRLDGRSVMHATAVGASTWQDETADFFSSLDDINTDHGLGPTHRRRLPALPFCSTSCHTNSLVAIGDEDGYIRLIDAGDEYSDRFKHTHLVAKSHDNAIMDLEFSHNDQFLATASGDQTCQIIDIPAQKSVWTLTGHQSSVKKVQFQPNELNILASCARDGSISIWDTRINPGKLPPRQVVSSMTEHMQAVDPVRKFWDAHSNRGRTRPAYSGRMDYSVTALTFLDPSRPHHIATTSETDSIVKLWDIRAKHEYRYKTTPISCTAEPTSHERHRRFGITSMVASTDASKIYTLCRDHTVYAYSTSHLILGSAPEMSPNAPAFKGEKHGAKPGLGPLYGFRDPSMAVTTFYLKLALRRATDTHSELLAIGSSDHCAVLFPTADRYLTKSARTIPTIDANVFNHPTGRLRLTRTDSQSTSLALRQRATEDDIPIYYHGTPLIRGHQNEVTAVTWSSEGVLVTCSDDLATRCWRENGVKAREMRTGYEGKAERYGCGWAAVKGRGYDDEV